jgi:hypothetical protein
MLALPAPVGACDFEEPPPPEVALEEAHAVFAGEVVSIEPVDDDPSEQFDAVTFAVDRTWKGVESSPVTIETHQDEGICGYPFEQGESYLVYAYGADAFMTTALYHRTTQLDRADEDLEVLGEGTEVTAQVENDADEGFNPGVAILLVVIISIILATIMLLRQSKPGLPDNYDRDDEPDFDDEDEDEDRRNPRD